MHRLLRLARLWGPMEGDLAACGDAEPGADLG